MKMREAVMIVLAGRRAARQVGHQFIIDDVKLRDLGFSYDQRMEIRSYVLEIENWLEDKLSRIP